MLHRSENSFNSDLKMPSESGGGGVGPVTGTEESRGQAAIPWNRIVTGLYVVFPLGDATLFPIPQIDPKGDGSSIHGWVEQESVWILQAGTLVTTSHTNPSQST
jgi:hypothetical protein